MDSLVENETSRLLADGVFDPDMENAQIVEEYGAGERTRTVDLLITNENQKNEESD